MKLFGFLYLKKRFFKPSETPVYYENQVFFVFKKNPGYS